MVLHDDPETRVKEAASCANLPNNVRLIKIETRQGRGPLILSGAQLRTKVRPRSEQISLVKWQNFPTKSWRPQIKAQSSKSGW
jgi:hypothetical protein